MKNFFKIAVGLSLLIGAFIYMFMFFTSNNYSLPLESYPLVILNGLGLVAIGWGFLSCSTEEMIRFVIIGVASFIAQKIIAAFFPDYITWFDKEMLESVLKAVFK